MAESLVVTYSIQDEYFRSLALCELAHYVPEFLMSESLVVVRSLKSEFYRAEALCGLVSKL